MAISATHGMVRAIVYGNFEEVLHNALPHCCPSAGTFCHHRQPKQVWWIPGAPALTLRLSLRRRTSSCGHTGCTLESHSPRKPGNSPAAGPTLSFSAESQNNKAILPPPPLRRCLRSLGKFKVTRRLF